MKSEIFPPHGGYQKLLSYQRTEMVYDATVVFCQRFIPRHSRTIDQMVQAARSGKQNIVEASVAAGTSREMEIKLTGVARASLEELLTDYRDFLRQHGYLEWPRSHVHAQRLSKLLRGTTEDVAKVKRALTHPDPVLAAQVIIGVIKVTCYLLDRQMMAQETQFKQDGGMRERMTRVRLAERRKGTTAS